MSLDLEAIKTRFVDGYPVDGLELEQAMGDDIGLLIAEVERLRGLVSDDEENVERIVARFGRWKSLGLTEAEVREVLWALNRLADA